MPALPLTTRCRAKINLTLRVLGRRPDGYHELDSLVAFAGVGDTLTLAPGPELALTLAGPFGAGLASEPDNLVLKAARVLADEAGPLRSGRFHLVKRLPLASGIGGGSADAAGALRLLARLNGIAADDSALLRAAAKAGADVPVCLDSRARTMAGLGEVLGPRWRCRRSSPCWSIQVSQWRRRRCSENWVCSLARGILATSALILRRVHSDRLRMRARGVAPA
jgi:4-diphosphocytidyl-2-C-methyl-D-erythritol kinase